jgi:ribosome-associated translation inhibitor RaiA
VQIKISARHGQLSDATREKISAKVEKLARLFERLSAIEVTIDLEHEQKPAVDLRVSAEHKHDFVAAEDSTSNCANTKRKCKTIIAQRLRDTSRRHWKSFKATNAPRVGHEQRSHFVQE